MTLRRCTLFLALSLLLAASAPAQMPTPANPPPMDAEPLTPLNAPLHEEAETLITCQLTQTPTPNETRIFESPQEAATARGVWHYRLWLPKGYLADPFKAWPCMFIMSPDGNATMGNMAAHLKSKGYVVVLLVESRNGPWGPVVGDFLAAHDDVVKRVRVAEGKKFATGQSGGARGSSLFVQARPGFGGVILQAAGAAANAGGYLIQGFQRNPRLYVAMTMGNADSNRDEVNRMKTAFNQPARFRAFDFPGGHDWAPRPPLSRPSPGSSKTTDLPALHRAINSLPGWTWRFHLCHPEPSGAR